MRVLLIGKEFVDGFFWAAVGIVSSVTWVILARDRPGPCRTRTAPHRNAGC